MTIAIAALAFALPFAAGAQSGHGEKGPGQRGNERPAFVGPELARAAKENPNQKITVIIQAVDLRAAENAAKGAGGQIGRRLGIVNAVTAELPAAAIEGLSKNPNVVAVTVDGPMRPAGFTNLQQWPQVSGLTASWKAAEAGVKAPTIAIVDSGIEASRADFGGRVVAQVTMTSLTPNSPGDGRGHGTFVAGIAAGSAVGYAGGAPNADIVSIDVMDDYGMAMTSDVIAAAEWIYQNKAAFNIRVANFSLHTANPTTFMYDPLNKAVEKLWFSGVVVVAAAGNYAVAGAQSGVPYAPGNDPFVITVGASDISGTIGANDDVGAPWSAYGYTLDGFAKPDLAAPGRYVVGPVPMTSTLALERPASIVAPGYIQMSGTSFSAPLVASAAAYALAIHPGWTPDQVKGALMLTAKAAPNAKPLSVGVGEVYAESLKSVTNPPNPNLALNQFVVSESGGSGKVFDAASWSSVAQADASWSSASWSSASWSSASWSSASWSSASWSSASWSSASWTSASWSSASWESASWEDGAADDVSPTGGYLLEGEDLYRAEIDLQTDIDGDGFIGDPLAAATSIGITP